MTNDFSYSIILEWKTGRYSVGRRETTNKKIYIQPERKFILEFRITCNNTSGSLKTDVYISFELIRLPERKNILCNTLRGRICLKEILRLFTRNRIILCTCFGRVGREKCRTSDVFGKVLRNIANVLLCVDSFVWPTPAVE